MGYVALSRVSSLDGIKLLGFNDMTLKVGQEVLEADQEFRKKSERAKKKLENTSTEEINQRQEEFLESVQGGKDKDRKTT